MPLGACTTVAGRTSIERRTTVASGRRRKTYVGYRRYNLDNGLQNVMTANDEQCMEDESVAEMITAAARQQPAAEEPPTIMH